jgi:hypothetical protein
MQQASMESKLEHLLHATWKRTHKLGGKIMGVLQIMVLAFNQQPHPAVRLAC